MRQRTQDPLLLIRAELRRLRGGAVIVVVLQVRNGGRVKCLPGPQTVTVIAECIRSPQTNDPHLAWNGRAVILPKIDWANIRSNGRCHLNVGRCN